MKISKGLFVIIYLFVIVNFVQAQDSIVVNQAKYFENSDVQWINQWPSAERKQKTKSASTKIKNFIFGKKITELSKPVSIFVSNQNRFWILDQGINSVFEVNKNEGAIPHFIEKKNFNFSSLVGTCPFSNNRILFTDSYLQKIFVITPDTKDIKILNDSLILEQPTGIAYSKVKNEIWVVETSKHRVSILNDKGELIKRLGIRGIGKGEFNFPTHIWIDKDGNVYIIDSMNFRVQVFNKEGEIISVFGSNGDATGYFARPKGIATDSHGNIYIVDALFNAVQIFDIKGNFLYKFGAQGQGQGQFWMPSGVFIDENDNIYIADCYNSRIQMFQLINGNKK